MADTVDTIVMYSSPRRRKIRITNISDGTGESGVVKIDKSALTGPDGTEPSKLVVEEIDWDIDGMQVRLFWDHTTDDEIAVLSGAGYRDYTSGGKTHGLVDPGSAGDTGDILLTTNAHTAGDGYDIMITVRLKD